MKKHWLFLLTVCTAFNPIIYSAEKENPVEESLSLRRIAEYWKEGEFATVKTQIKSFLEEHPQSAYADSLYAMLGDIYFKEKNYAEALNAYELISQEPFLQKTQFNHLYCLYDQGLYHDVVTCAEAYLKDPKGSKAQENTARFQMADSLFRLGKATDHPSAKEDLYNQALAHFKVLAQTDYAEQTIYPLAIIYSYLKENVRAAALFEKLAAKHPEQKEAFLFQAASLLLAVDKNAAIETYGKIYPLNGPHAGEAAFNQIQLLFEQKRYRDLLLTQETALKHIPMEQLNILRYYIGKSLVSLKDYQHAVPHLVQFVDSKSDDPHLVKNAYLSLVVCAKETHDMPLFDRSLKSLRTCFPNEKETAQALLLHVQICKDKQEFQRAQQDLLILASEFPGYSDREAVLYDYALLFSQSHQWNEGIKAFKEFLSAYPSSSKKPSAYRHMIMAQLEEAKSASPETAKVKKEKIIETLVITLGEKNIFSPLEKKQMRFLLGKTMYEIGQYKDAIVEMEDFVRDFPSDPSCGKAHLIMAHCYTKDGLDPRLFVLHAEKALALDKDTPKTLHLQLYNAYLLLAEQEHPDKKPLLIDQAADHLFFSLEQGVKNENRVWLANYYFNRYEHSSSENQSFYLARAIAVLENVLGFHGNNFHLAVSPGKLEVEAEAIKLSQLYTDAQRLSDAIALLSELNREYEANPDFSWNYRRLALFELGQNYEQIGDVHEAIQTYDSLIATASHVHSYFGIAARLQKTQLEYTLLSSKQKQENNKDLQSIFDSLKDLEIQRRLVTEPWHLEAALTYIDFKTAAVPEREKKDVQLQLVSRMHANFSSPDDRGVQNYLLAAEQFPEQFSIYQQYMKFLDAEELRLHALTMQGAEAEDSLREARLIYGDLMNQPIHDFLKSRIMQRIEELKTL
ncbi:MAG: tetratricopeptide repeat protein [Verrucomicrobia bacterium]|nr:tetratricopeptide repeat protein [Verrucomicrobiota bacterium]